ncbi:inovirus-type Gp2 protein [Methylomonas sp. LL1]|uniref:YagK/YfjJ domain-containing protein n=1 Tax=Methylomonas sp. LL1 TaxID=2785785 RepID=UPI0018C38D8A|nr:inovirus-type Gp2 protein [Methylomonas sp. LL1]QPK62897.1 inovirus-type Gp2 protein [Methylomonas sp. LL1]
MKNYNLIDKEFTESMFGFDGEHRIINEAFDCALAIITADKVAKEIIGADDKIFYARKISRSSNISCICSKYPSILFYISRFNKITKFEKIEKYLPIYRLNPLVICFKNQLNSLSEEILFYSNSPQHDYWAFTQSVKIETIETILNKFVENFKSEVDSDEFSKKYDNFERLLRKNAKSISDHIGAIFELYQSVLSIRFQLSYKFDRMSEKIISEAEMLELHETAKSDFDSFMKNWRTSSDFNGAVGYIWKLDYSSLMGFRYRVFLFFDASIELSLTEILKKLQDRWLLINDKDGLFIDFNTPDIDLTTRGIGTFKNDDKSHREALTNAACSMIGINYFSNPSDCKNGRLFGKGLKLAKEQHMAA